MAEAVITRARGLFQYADLGGDSQAGGGGMVWTRKKKTLAFGGTVAAVLLIIIIAAAAKHNRGSQTIRSQKFTDDRSTNTDDTGNPMSSPFYSPVTHSGPKQRMTLKDMVYQRFRPNTFNGTWISDHEVVFHTEKWDGIKVLNVHDPSKSYTLMTPEMMAVFFPADIQISADKKYVLLKRQSYTEYKRFQAAKYSILSMRDNGKLGSEMVDLKPNNKGGGSKGSGGRRKTMGSADHGFLRHVVWAPVGNGLAYVDYDNNVFVRRSVKGTDEQLTDDGKPWMVFNGIPDWVFDEEVFEENNAIWWAPDGNKLAWGSFDDTQVDVYLLPKYGGWSSTSKLSLYPGHKELRYPKVGRKNPINKLYVAEFDPDSVHGRFDKHEVMRPPSFDESQGIESHFSYVTWTPDSSSLAVTWFNRVQNRTIVDVCTLPYSEERCSEAWKFEQKGGWIDYKYRLVFNPNPPNPKAFHDFVTIAPATFVKHHYRQIIHVFGDKETDRTFLTRNETEVTEILAWKDDHIYFISTWPGEPGSRHIFRVASPTAGMSSSNDGGGGGGEGGIQCLTCDKRGMEYLNRKSCQYYSASMSKGDQSYFAMTCHGPDVPWACIHNTDNGSLVTVYEENSQMVELVQEYDLPSVDYMSFSVSNSDQKARVKLYYPPNFDREEKYALVVHVYGGPGYQLVDYKFDQSDYQSYLTSNYPVIYAIVDPKGSGFQGTDWLFEMYRRFGVAEAESTLEVAKQLKALPYVDADNVAIWGWSYGGYLSLTALAKDKGDVFKCGASVAPVTDWRLYDTYYTERYMGTIHDNAAGYNRSAVFNYLENLRKKKLFVMHGTRDDNVHIQQTMLLTEALEEKDILFRQQFYPDQDHSIPKYHKHLYHSLTDFFINDCFNAHQ